MKNKYSAISRKQQAIRALVEEFSFRANGSSMCPAIRMGDTLRVKPANSYQLGDVLLFERDGAFVAHRLIAARMTSDGQRYITRGDSLLQDDEPVAPEDVLGRVQTQERNGKTIPIDGSWGTFWLKASSISVFGTPLMGLGATILRSTLQWVAQSLKTATASQFWRPFKRAVVFFARIEVFPADNAGTAWPPSVEGADDVLPVQLRDATDSCEAFYLQLTLAGYRLGSIYTGPMWEVLRYNEDFIGGIWVHPLFRGAGLGSTLVLKAMKEAASRGVRTVYCNIRVDNTPSLAMFRKVGFESVVRTDMAKAIERELRSRAGQSSRQVVMRSRSHVQNSDQQRINPAIFWRKPIRIVHKFPANKRSR